MRAYAAIQVLGRIAVPTEGLKPWGEIIFAEPHHHFRATSNFFPVHVPVVGYVINAKEDFFRFSATSTLEAVVSKNRISEECLTAFLFVVALTATDTVAICFFSANNAQAFRTPISSTLGIIRNAPIHAGEASGFSRNRWLVAFRTKPNLFSSLAPCLLVFAVFGRVFMRHCSVSEMALVQDIGGTCPIAKSHNNASHNILQARTIAVEPPKRTLRRVGKRNHPKEAANVAA
jgi:hypothetical protein